MAVGFARRLDHPVHADARPRRRMVCSIWSAMKSAWRIASATMVSVGFSDARRW